MNSQSSETSGAGLRLAMIGAGKHANRDLIPCMKSLPGVELVAIAGRDAEALERTARRWSVANRTLDWRGLIAGGGIDGVVACTGAEAHPDIVRACLERDLPIYVEKPPAMTAAQLRELEDLESSRPRQRVFVGYNFAFSAALEAATGALAEPADIRVLKVRFLSSSPESAGKYGSVEEAIVLEAGSHAIDLAIRRLGIPQEVVARFAAVSPGRIAITVLMIHQDRRQSLIELGNYLDRFAFDVELLTGDGRCARLEQLNRTTIWTAGGSGPRQMLEWGIRKGGYDRAGYGPALSAFCEMIREGTPSRSTLGHAASVHDVLEKILACGARGWQTARSPCPVP